MNKHNICQWVVASMLSITATAWAQKSVDFPIVGDAKEVALAKADGPVKWSESLFWFRVKNFEVGCHALSGPRCYAGLGKSPSHGCG
jgi:hypothetical protein